MPADPPRYFALVPAAGAGLRIGGSVPKQYLELAGRPLLHHTLSALAREPRIKRVFAVLAPGDTRFDHVCGDLDQVEALACGGSTRAASVYNGLVAAAHRIRPSDWVLVHDAARPCLSEAALARLIDEIGGDEVGGLLAVPVADTLKRADRDQRVLATESRDALWQAQTPQMFRYGVLIEALRRFGSDAVTDEASAVERMGLKPRLVTGEARNLKVTFAEDLALAEAVLRA